MTGMTGEVPYFGGRFSPAQAYAASHPKPPLPATNPAPPKRDPLEMLDELRETGVIDQGEYEQLRARITS